MKYIKLVASDLDGTLLDKNKEITPRLYHALEQMNEQGIYFVPATGRPFSTVPQAIKALPFLRYVITSNGAAIYDAVEKKAIIENNLSPNAVDAVIPIAKRLPVITEYFIHGKAYIAKSVYENLSPYGLIGKPCALYSEQPHPCRKFLGENAEKPCHSGKYQSDFSGYGLAKAGLGGAAGTRSLLRYRIYTGKY